MLRIRFYFITNLPFSTDAWTLIKNVEVIMREGYLTQQANSYEANWPASQLFSAILAKVIDANILELMAILFPLLSSFAIGIYYLLLARITNQNMALIASLLLSVSGYNVFFTAGVTKETFAILFFYISIFSYYLALKNKKYSIIFLISTIALLFSHHFSYLNLILPLIFFSISYTIYCTIHNKRVRRLPIILFAFSAILGLFYYNFISNLKVAGITSSSEIIIFSAYQIFFLYIFTKLKIINSETKGNISVIFFMLVIILAAYISYTFDLLDVSILTHPFFLSSFLLGIIMIYFASKGYKSISNLNRVFFLSLPIPFLAFYFYEVFASSYIEATFLSSRLLDFLFPTLFPLVAIGILNYKRKLRTIILGFILILFIIQNIAIYPLQINGSGYQWLYFQGEFEGIKWFASHTDKDAKIIGDMKVNQILAYFNLSSDVIKGYDYLYYHKNIERGYFIFVYEQMNNNGYVLFSKGEKIENLNNELNKYSKIYSNGDIEIFLS
jgi:hypothetical protein